MSEFNIEEVTNAAIINVENGGQVFTQSEKETIHRFVLATMNTISPSDLQAIVSAAKNITTPEPTQLDLFS